MIFLLKWLLCFVAPILFLVCGLGLVFGGIFALVKWYYVIIPVFSIAAWIWVANEIHDDFFE